MSYASPQCAKFVNSSSADGITKVLAFNGYFGGVDRSAGKLEHSNLHRFALEGHFVQKKANGKNLTSEEYIKKEFSGNIPIENFPTILTLSKNALFDKTISDGTGYIKILDSGWKPSVKVKDEDGNCLCYNIIIEYQGSLRAPIKITITNAYAPVVSYSDGRMNIKLSELNKKEELQMYISITEWYNKITNCWDNWQLYRQRLNMNGYYDDEFMLSTNN